MTSHGADASSLEVSNMETKTRLPIDVMESVRPPPSFHDRIFCWIQMRVMSVKELSEPRKFYQQFVAALHGLFPILVWGRNYNRKQFKSDLLAGLTLASLSVPQSIGYANLAKLDPQYGLYTSFIPPLVYAVMGTSREVAIGPVAVVSLLLSSMIQGIADPLKDPSAYRRLMFTVTFLTGTFQAAFGFFRLGFIIDFLSHAAVVGFMGGAAVMIGLQQLKGLLGLAHFTNQTDLVSVIKTVIASLQHTWHPYNFLIGCGFLIFILIARFLGRRNKKYFWLAAIAPLLSVIISTLLVFITRGDDNGIITVKHVEAGLNLGSADQLILMGPQAGQAAKIALVAALIALTEAMAVGRSFATIKGYHLDGNKEMVAMGFMNIIGSLNSCYVATGSFSRTAVNFSAGCQTAMSNIIMAITVLAAMELLARLLYFTPTAILASIILSSLPGLIDFKEAYNIWEVDKLDFLACCGAFFGVIFASVEIGLLVALVISFTKILFEWARPQTEILGRLPGTDIFCSIKQYPFVLKTPGIVITKIKSAAFCFFNARCTEQRIMTWVELEMRGASQLHAVILDLSNMTNIDTSGILALEELHKKLVHIDLQLALANPAMEVIYKLKLAKFLDRVGKEWIFISVAEAINACLANKKSVV